MDISRRKFFSLYRINPVGLLLALFIGITAYQRDLENPADETMGAGQAPSSPVQVERRRTSDRIKEIEKRLGPTLPKVKGQTDEEIYDGLNHSEKALLTEYFRRAKEAGSTDGSARAEAARIFRKRRNVDVNARMVPKAVLETEQYEIAEERQKKEAAAKRDQLRQDAIAARDARIASDIRVIDAGSVERITDPVTGKKRVEWRTHLSMKYRPYLVFWYDVAADGTPSEHLHIALDNRVDPIIPRIDPKQTRVILGEKTMPMTSERDSLVYRDYAWDRLHFVIPHLALEGWGIKIGVQFQFGPILLDKPTDEQRVIMKHFLDEHKKDCQQHGVEIDDVDEYFRAMETKSV